MSASAGRPSVLVLLLIVVAMVVGGCTRSKAHTAAQPTGITTTPSSTPSTTPPRSAAPTASGAPTCTTSHLKVTFVRDAGGGAAGSSYSHVAFRNTGSSSCAITGWPGVSYLRRVGGTQVGSPADRTGSPEVITLKPGARAEALLRETHAGNFDGCNITSVDGVRIYPPNNTAPVFVTHSTEACTNTGVHLMTIGPVRRG